MRADGGALIRGFGELAISGNVLVGLLVWGLFGGVVWFGGGHSLNDFPPPAVGWPLFLGLGVVYFSLAYLLLYRIGEDPRIIHHFEESNLDRLHEKLVEQLVDVDKVDAEARKFLQEQYCPSLVVGHHASGGAPVRSRRAR